MKSALIALAAVAILGGDGMPGRVNLKGVLYGLGAVLPIMQAQKSGHNIFVSSVAGHVVNPVGAVYCATKTGIRVIVEALRQEVKEWGGRTLSQPENVDINEILFRPIA